jgi:hypothetical protein
MSNTKESSFFSRILSPLYRKMSIRLCTQMARAIVAQAKTTFMAGESAVARGKATVEADINQDLLAQSNPLIGGLLNSFPTLKKTLRRNPGLMNFAMEKMASIMAGKKNGSGGSPAATSQTMFNL